MSITGTDFISFETSQNMLNLLQVNNHRYERVPLSEALGRVLAEDVVARFNDPQFPTASMDGYAVKYEDLELGELKFWEIIQRDMMRDVF